MKPTLDLDADCPDLAHVRLLVAPLSHAAAAGPIPVCSRSSPTYYYYGCLSVVPDRGVAYCQGHLPVPAHGAAYFHGRSLVPDRGVACYLGLSQVLFVPPASHSLTWVSALVHSSLSVCPFDHSSPCLVRRAGTGVLGACFSCPSYPLCGLDPCGGGRMNYHGCPFCLWRDGLGSPGHPWVRDVPWDLVLGAALSNLAEAGRMDAMVSHHLHVVTLQPRKKEI